VKLMHPREAERAQRERMAVFYERARSPVMQDIERRVCGCDYGASSWTTRAEADALSELLGLKPGDQLLDVGAGSGWPGLYMASQRGCDVILVDLPLAGLRIASERSLLECNGGRCSVTVADAAQLPFGLATFDALSHSDLLCCLRDKQAALASCRQVLRVTGRMALTVISLATGLTALQKARAIEAGPLFVEAPMAYPELLRETGWRVIEVQDLSAASIALCGQFIASDNERREALIELLGQSDFDDRQSLWHARLSGLREGLLRRQLFVATPVG